MKKFFVLTMMLMMICATTFAEELKPPIISVSGEGVVEVAPDRATISVAVITREKNPSAVQSSNAQAAQSVINSIVALGIERKNISTGNYNFNPTYRQRNDGRSEIDGYEATNSVTVIVDDLSLVGKIIDTALSHGANRVDSLSFGLRNKTAYQDEALRLAILDAKHKAEVAARALGKNIVGVREASINSASVSSPRNYKLARAMVEDFAAGFDTPVESGTLNCSASVHVEFE
ncbi:MAG: SIMPL domain-containing protein, partial [Selenomonadaceae bacterium]|nr:SIMPL domain-containing protein [Selenomonadaceae bacterium]